jgi:lipopolysaccharide export system permease protein
MDVFNRYLIRNLLIATIFVAITLAGIILLTQSLRFLELVLESGASGSAFWMLTMLAMPRFFEIILPVALMAAIVFIYNKLTMDSELVVMRGLGRSPMQLARPAILLSAFVALVLVFMTAWLAPLSLTSMQHLRQVIKAQYSTVLFRPGVFTDVGQGVTVYIRERTQSGELRGMMIHDNRESNESPVTILAQRGVILVTDEGHQVVVYNGNRQDVNPQTGIMNRLEFERYTIDLPDQSGPVRQRWREPEERTIWELFRPDLENQRDMDNQHEFAIEIHRRLIAPLMAPALALMSLAFLLLGPVDRRGQSKRIIAIILSSLVVQGLYLGAFSMAQKNGIGLILFYASVLVPFILGLYLLSDKSEAVRRRWVRSGGMAALGAVLLAKQKRQEGV